MTANTRWWLFSVDCKMNKSPLKTGFLFGIYITLLNPLIMWITVGRSVFQHPLHLAISAIIGGVIGGVIFGIFTRAWIRKNPQD